MNILCCDQFAELGGGQRSLLDLLPAFRTRTWTPHVVLPEEGTFSRAVCSLGVSVDFCPIGNFQSGRKPVREMCRFARQLPFAARCLLALISTHNADLIYVTGPRLIPAAASAARLSGVPLVYHCHNRIAQRSAIVLTGCSLRLSEAFVISCCHFAVEPLTPYVAKDRVSVIYNGISGVRSNRRGGTQRLRRIGVVGRIEPEKGQLEFVQAVRALSPGFLGCRFSVIGAPMFSNVDYYGRVRLASEGLPIEFPGWQDDVGRVFSNLDLLVVPSCPIEATTRVILEAYSAGIPVVAFPSGGIPEIVIDGETGFLANGNTPEALAARIASVIHMRAETVHSIAMNAQRIWRAKYTLERYQEQVCGALAAVCVGKRAAAA